MNTFTSVVSEKRLFQEEWTIRLGAAKDKSHCVELLSAELKRWQEWLILLIGIQLIKTPFLDYR